MAATVFERNRTRERSPIIHGQRSSYTTNQESNLSQANSPHRTQIPLYTTTSPRQEDESDRHSGQGESCRYLNETDLDEQGASMDKDTWNDWMMDEALAEWMSLYGELGAGESVRYTPLDKD